MIQFNGIPLAAIKKGLVRAAPKKDDNYDYLSGAVYSDLRDHCDVFSCRFDEEVRLYVITQDGLLAHLGTGSQSLLNDLMAEIQECNPNFSSLSEMLGQITFLDNESSLFDVSKHIKLSEMSDCVPLWDPRKKEKDLLGKRASRVVRKYNLFLQKIKDPNVATASRIFKKTDRKILALFFLNIDRKKSDKFLSLLPSPFRQGILEKMPNCGKIMPFIKQVS